MVVNTDISIAIEYIAHYVVDVFVLHEGGSYSFVYHVGDQFFVHVVEVCFLCLVYGEMPKDNFWCAQDWAYFGSSIACL